MGRPSLRLGGTVDHDRRDDALERIVDDAAQAASRRARRLRATDSPPASADCAPLSTITHWAPCVFHRRTAAPSCSRPDAMAHRPMKGYLRALATSASSSSAAAADEAGFWPVISSPSRTT